MLRSIPIDSTTSALRSALSAYCCAAIEAWFACISGGLVLRSLNQPTTTSTTPNASAVQPSTGLIKNSNTIINSATGDSITASNTGENRKSRTCRKSFIGCCVPPGSFFRLA